MPQPDDLRLFVNRPAGVVEIRLPSRGTYTIGRGSECNVAIEDATVSRVHAILHAGADLVVEDCKSRNGTRIDGRKLAPGERRRWPAGAPLELGSVTVRVERARAHTTVDTIEPERIRRALHDAQGDPSEAARMLGISRVALTNKLNEIQFPIPPKRA
jgi:pSer/pThr/pTyr-binding forkhead associated (FHA) protein